MVRDTLIKTLQELGFTQYEAQCYLGLLRQHPLNGSQLSAICGVPRSMVYQTLTRLEEKAAIVRLSAQPGEPQRYEPVAPHLVIAHRSATFQATCERAERELLAFMETTAAEVVLNLVGNEAILRTARSLLRQAEQHLALMGEANDLAELRPELQAASERGVTLRMVSIGADPAPGLHGQLVSFAGEPVSAPTRFLLVIAERSRALIATFPPATTPSAALTENPILARLLLAFLNIEYYLARVTNRYPALIRAMLSHVLEPEDRERYAHTLRSLARLARTRGTQSAGEEHLHAGHS